MEKRVEIYYLSHDGQSLYFRDNNFHNHTSGSISREFNDFFRFWDGKDTVIEIDDEKFEQQYTLGHEENILCKIYKRSVNGFYRGGMIAVFENLNLLIIAYAPENLTYIEGIAHYAKIATYTRYGYDIFLEEEDY